MNFLDRMLQQYWHIAWGFISIVAVVIGFGAGDMARMADERNRLDRLQYTAGNASKEISALIMNGQLVGTISASGIVDAGLKPDGKDNPLLTRIGQAVNADGVFVFNRSGIVGAAWNQNGKHTVGMDISDRPYYREAMRNRSSVHVAVSPTSGVRGIYFSTPLRAPTGNPIGALVVRTGVDSLQTLLAKQTDIALFVSPEGIVFAGNREDWIGRLTEAFPATRIAEMQTHSPIGALIEQPSIPALALPSTDGITTFAGKRYAVANATVLWSHDNEKWRLILAEDLSRSLPLSQEWVPMLLGALGTFLTGAIVLILLRRKYDRESATRQMQAILAQQEAQTINKTRLSEASLRFQQTGSAEELGHAYLDTTHVLLGVLQGGVYRIAGEGPGTLQRLADFGCTGDIPLSFDIGEGLPGQCALEKKKLIVDGVKPDYWKIVSALAEAVPTRIVLIPVMRHERLLGVVEIALMNTLDDGANEILDELTMLLSLNLEIHLRNAKTQQLLDETRSQSRELEVQAARIEQTALRLAAQEETEKDIHAWYNNIIASVSDGVAIVSDDGNITQANTALAMLFGYTIEELAGEALARLLPEWQSTTTAGASTNLSGTRRDGSKIDVSITLIELPATSGQRPSRCAVIRASAPPPQQEYGPDTDKASDAGDKDSFRESTEAEDASAKPLPMATAPTDNASHLAGARLLLVEDNDLNQELITGLLELYGMEVAVAGHGRAALDILASDTAFDGILMDCQMPVMDGYTATQAIRRDPRLAGIPIIAITTDSFEANRTKVVDAGMNDLIAKPVNAENMISTLARWLRRES